MKTVLITGAGRGIGLALTKEFVAHDFTVLATYRSEKDAKELLQFAKEHPVTPVKADVTDENSLAALIEPLQKLGTLNVLVNNSGVIGDRGRSLLESNMQTVAQTFNVNTLGPMRVTKLVLPFMKAGGTITQITSLMGSITDNSSGGYYDYRMSKTALNMFNMCLAKEFPKITCLALHPGWVKTEMGGAGAQVPTDECAQGLFKLISKASLKQTGQFFDYQGKALPW